MRGGYVDYPADPGCTSNTDTTESPNPTNGPNCDGRRATIYVANGTIVGGPDSGQLYTGTLRGTDGADLISGTARADTIIAGDGNDAVCAIGGADTVSGEGGNDRLYGGGGDGADRFIGGGGTDTATDYNSAQGDTRTTIP